MSKQERKMLFTQENCTWLKCLIIEEEDLSVAIIYYSFEVLALTGAYLFFH